MIKFIADVNIEKKIVDYLHDNGYDVKWVPDYNCTISDNDLIRIAKREKRVLITNDKDFGEITFLQRRVSAGIILIRVKGQKVRDKVKLMKKLLQKHEDRILKHFVVLTKDKMRFILMEDVK